MLIKKKRARKVAAKEVEAAGDDLMDNNNEPESELDEKFFLSYKKNIDYI